MSTPYNLWTLENSSVSSVTFNTNQTLVYAARNDGKIDVFNASSHSLVTTWNVGTTLGGMSLSADGSYLLVAEQALASRAPGNGSGTLHRVNTTTGAVQDYAINTPHRDAEVVDDNSTILTGINILKFGLDTGIYTALPLAAFHSSDQDIFIRDGHLTLIAEAGLSSGPLFLYDDRQGKIVATGDNSQIFATGGFNLGNLAISEEAAVVAQGVHGAGDTINLYDLSLHFVKSIHVSYTIDGISFSDDGNYFYVRSVNTGFLTKYDTHSWQIVDQFDIGNDAYPVVSPAGQSAPWLPNLGNGDQIHISTSGQFITVADSATGKLQLLDFGSIQGDDGDNVLNGSAGDNVLIGGRGNDTLNGGGGQDTAIINDVMANSTITAPTPMGQGSATTYPTSPITVDGADGRDTLNGIARIQFNDGVIYTANLSAIDSVFTPIFGRHPTTAEYAAFSAVLQTPVSAAQVQSIFTAPEFDTFLSAAITSIYQNYAGRDPNGGETGAWKAAIRAGESLAQMRVDILNNPLGMNYTAQAITQTYQTFAGRAPVGNEIAAWQDVFRSGGSVQTLRQALLSDPGVQGLTAATVATIYQTYAGRSPTSGEISAAQTMLIAGSDFAGVRAAVLDTPTIHAYELAQIGAAYQTYAGRAPNASEISAWDGALHAGATYGTIRDAIASAMAKAQTEQQIDDAYQTYAGRHASAGELTAWENFLDTHNHDYTAVRDAILNTSLGRTYTDVQINAAYQTYAGRAAGAGELTAWENFLNTNNHNYTAVRDAILNTSLGTAYTDAQINAAYQTYAGRAAGASELTAWENFLNTNNHNYTVVRDAILNTSLGKAYTDAQIDATYRTYAGRAAGANEINAWENFLNGNNHDYNAVRAAILSDPGAQVYANSQIDTFYQRFFQRPASAGEQAAWRGVFSTGAEFNALRDALMSSPGSSATVQQLTGTSGADTFHLPTSPNNIVITGFDPAHDAIDLQGRGYSAIDPLDAGHARQIVALDGSIDLLISLDATHDILLHNVQLSQLSGSDFLL